MSTALPKLSQTPSRPRVVPILKIVDEASSMKSLTFRDKLTAAALPGQFGMVWAPGVDEVPMSLLPRDDNIVTITVKQRGSGTSALLRKRERDLIGVRGPYGRGFTCTGVKKVLMIGGGTGAIPLLALLRKLASTDVKCSFILGAHTSHELLFRSEIERLSDGTRGMFNVTTDDGSTGSKGLATDETARVLRAGLFDRIYTCGPEEMMKKVVDLATEAQIPAEAGLERIFKCGSGICGSCCIGPYLACKDGPVFSSDTLKGLREFGKSTRDASGRQITIGRS
ncbi:MAG TPA: dihydroorotate dehydrogenase electron transfer subunit [Candidatus Acidoferrum sp.]|nr:dihydroorotate dehydrogenase electron transfer subunit [Candidatus Acidoferrum sp.]